LQVAWTLESPVAQVVAKRAASFKNVRRYMVCFLHEFPFKTALAGNEGRRWDSASHIHSPSSVVPRVCENFATSHKDKAILRKLSSHISMF
jgi:hypothetical protein